MRSTKNKVLNPVTAAAIGVAGVEQRTISAGNWLVRDQANVLYDATTANARRSNQAILRDARLHMILGRTAARSCMMPDGCLPETSGALFYERISRLCAPIRYRCLESTMAGRPATIALARKCRRIFTAIAPATLRVGIDIRLSMEA